MFCEKCGKELKDNWKKCPYCGQTVGKDDVKMRGETKMSGQVEPAWSENRLSGKEPRKKGRIKKILLGIGVVLAVLVVLSVAFSSDNEENGDSKSGEDGQEESTEVKTLEEMGGFAQWQEDGFPGRVRANISVDFPLLNTDKNHYGVYIGVGGINIGIIMQEDEKPVKEWEWLMNAEPYEDTQKAYFNGVLKYLGQKDDGEMPVFLISDIGEGDYLGDGQKTESNADIDLEGLIGQPEEKLKDAGFTYNEDSIGYEFLDGKVIADCMDGKVYMIILTGSGEGILNFHGVKVGMTLEEADALLADKYSKAGELEGKTAYIDLEARNGIGLVSANGSITEIDVTHFTEEELQEYVGNSNEEKGEKSTGGDEESIENSINSTGNFETDVANEVLYAKDGVVVDVNGNVLPEYADYFITEDGYISNGDWVEEGYGVDSTGKIVNYNGLQSDAVAELETIQNTIETAKQVDIETLFRSPSIYNNTDVCIEATLRVDGFFDNFFVSGNGQDIRIFASSTIDVDGNLVEKLLSGDHVMIVGKFKYQDYYHEYLGEMQSTMDNAIVILLD